MSHRWPGWTKLPGIDLAPLAEKARVQGEPWAQYSYVWAHDQRYVTTATWQVDADGVVSMPWDARWEPAVSDGMLTGFRRADDPDVIEELVKISALIVPEGEPPWSPALTLRLPPEQIGLCGPPGDLAAVLDVEADDACASIVVGIVGDDDGMTQVAWGITRESAASLIAMIRSRHGEPLHEVIVDPGQAEGFQDAAFDALDEHAVQTCAHER